MIKGMRVKNLRSLRDTGHIEFSRINVLLGRNSSGKSSFARLFPLMKQSSQKRTRGPILWYGEGDYVDFGSFENALYDRAEDKEIVFSFRMDASLGERSRWYNDEFLMGKNRFRRHRYGDQGSFPIEASLHLRSDGKNTFTSMVEIKALQNNFQLIFNENHELSELYCSGEKWASKGGKTKIYAKDNSFFPWLVAAYKEDGGMSEVPAFLVLRQDLIEKIKNMSHANTKHETIIFMSNGLPLKNKKDFYDTIMRSRRYADYFKKKVKYCWEKDRKDFDDLYRKFLLGCLENIMFSISMEVRDFCSGVKYLRPLRAHAQRYYRRQELAVDEVDASGENIHMFLDSLSLSESNDLSSWMYHHLGFSVSSVASSGHVEIMIEDSESGYKRNIADMGFGYSQLIPIAIQVWACLRGGQSTNGVSDDQKSVVIEQPELHLHPSLQKKFSDLMVGVISENPTVNFFIETHSQHMVNRIGTLVAMKKAQASDVSIFLFENQKEEGFSTIAKAGFNSEGVLTNWPFGFFEGD